MRRDFKVRSVTDEIKTAIQENKGIFLFEDGLYNRYFFIDNAIVASWPVNPNELFTPIGYGEISLDDFIKIKEEYKEYCETKLEKIYDFSEKERKIGAAQKKVQLSLLEKTEKVIAENEAAIREREYNRDVLETSNRINANLGNLLKDIKHMAELGKKGEWYISRNGETLLEMSSETKERKKIQP